MNLASRSSETSRFPVNPVCFHLQPSASESLSPPEWLDRPNYVGEAGPISESVFIECHGPGPQNLFSTRRHDMKRTRRQGVPHAPMCRAQQPEHARRPPAPTAKHREPLSAAGAVGAADRIRVGDHAHPAKYRTPRQNDDRRCRGCSTERILRVHSRSASTLGVRRCGLRREPLRDGL
jgi:hypothetical protein